MNDRSHIQAVLDKVAATDRVARARQKLGIEALVSQATRLQQNFERGWVLDSELEELGALVASLHDHERGLLHRQQLRKWLQEETETC
jgi:hypothetical protein